MDAGRTLLDNSPHPLARIRASHLLPDLLDWAADVCGLGSVRSAQVCDVGYDDCNVVVATGRGTYVVKIFTAVRTRSGTGRYVGIIERVVAAGVAHPTLRRDGDGRALLTHPASGNDLIVMDHVAGSTFFDLRTHPTDAELDLLMEQVRRIHAVDHHLQFVEDWWAVANIAALAAEVSPLLDPADRPFVDRAVHEFARIDRDALPHALVHGDLTKANVIRRTDGGLALLDFAVSNRYPRIQEMAMIVVNLMHGDPRPLPTRIALIARRYGAGDPLSRAELAALPGFVLATAAMELLGAAREWTVKGNRSDETRFLLGVGRAAIREAAHPVSVRSEGS